MRLLDMFHEFVLLVAGPDDENRAGVGDRLRHLFQERLILAIVMAGPLLLAMIVANRPVGVDDDLVGVLGVEVEDARLRDDRSRRRRDNGLA